MNMLARFGAGVEYYGRWCSRQRHRIVKPRDARETSNSELVEEPGQDERWGWRDRQRPGLGGLRMWTFFYR